MVKPALTKNDMERIRSILSRSGKMSANDYPEQVFWLLFLRVLDNAEDRLEKVSEGSRKAYEPILEPEYRWSAWIKREWKNDEDVLLFMNKQLFPCLKGLSGTREKSKISEIFMKIGVNKIANGSDILEIGRIMDFVRIGHNKDARLLFNIYEEFVNGDGIQNLSLVQPNQIREIISLMTKVIERIHYLILLRYQEMFY